MISQQNQATDTFPKTDRKTTVGIVLTILISCLLVSLAQGSSFFYSPHHTKVLILSCLFFLYAGLFLYLKASHGLTENAAVYMMILLGVLLRCSYVLLSGLYERQHDAGAYTGMGTDFANPGHIGYIEYIYKFHKLPDFNPYQLFSYYHPPLHHLLSTLWLRLNILMGVPEELAFENLQIPTLLYSCLCTVVTWKILKLLKIKGRGLYTGLALMVFHPAVIIMAGSVNNDMLTILFMCLVILGTLQWIRRKDLKGLVKLALYIGLGMITKLNSAVLTFPIALIFFVHFLSVIRQKDKNKTLQWIRNYCIFGAVAAPIGLSWILRNLIRFGEKPGISDPGMSSPMYAGSYSLWKRIGIPSLADWHFDFPFHSINAKAGCNTWVIMFHTSLFAEEYPADLPDVLLVLCQITFVLAIILGIATVILLFFTLLDKRTDFEDRLFLLSGYGIMMVSFTVFAAKYPYTCSSDFRYVAICLVFIAIALGLGSKYYLPASFSFAKNPSAKAVAYCMTAINIGIIMVLTGITLIYLFWNRW